MITYTFKIKTSPKLIESFEHHLNVTRLVYNLAKEVKEEAYKKGIKLSRFDLINQISSLSKEFDWIRVVNSFTLQHPIDRLEDGYVKFFRDYKKGKHCSKPFWAKKSKWRSLQFRQSNLGKTFPSLRFEGNKFKLPKIGLIKIYKSCQINGNIKLARVLQKADGWYLQVVTDHDVPKSDNQAIIGIDRGLKYLAVTSDGEYVENLKVFERYEKQLRIENRKLSRQKNGSSNRHKQVIRIQLLYLKMSRVKEDYLHKVSKKLADKYGTIVLEDLNIQNMIRSNLSKYISSVSWHKFEEYLGYKTNVVKVNPMYTSQECSSCGYTSKENRKTQDQFQCKSCGTELNADYNASINILKRGQMLLSGNVSR